MPKVYGFEIKRAGRTATYHNICHSDEAAFDWIKAQARLWDWGELGDDWRIKSWFTRPLNEVYELDADKTGYLCEIAEELFARETSNNCPNTAFRGLSWNDLCEAGIEILEALKGEG